MGEANDLQRISSNCGSRSPPISSDKNSNSDGGTPDMGSQHPSEEVDVDAERKEKKSKCSCVRELRSLLSGSPVMTRRSSKSTKEGENGSNLLALSNSSQMKAREKIRMRSRSDGFGLAWLNEKSLRSRRLPNRNALEEPKNNKRKPDSSRNSDFPEKSPATKKGRSYKEDKSSANSAATGSSSLFSCSNGIKNGNNNTPEKEEQEEVEYERCFFIGEPVSDVEARQRWPWRYEIKVPRVQSRRLTVKCVVITSLFPYVMFYSFYWRSVINIS